MSLKKKKVKTFIIFSTQIFQQNEKKKIKFFGDKYKEPL